MSKRKTHAEFLEEIKIKNPNVLILGEYKTAYQKISYKCTLCGREHEATPSKLLQGEGCPTCGLKKISQSLSKTPEEFEKELYIKNHKVELIGQYTNQKTKVTVKCLKCGRIWEAFPSNLLKGQGCVSCYGHQHKTTQIFIKEMSQIDSTIHIMGEYVNNSTKILCQCDVCKTLWEVTPAHLISNTGCPYCKKSKGEKKIIKYLEANNIPYLTQYRFDDCKNVRPLPFDFYIPQYNLCIEYDGEQHYFPVRFKGQDPQQAYSSYMSQKAKDKIKNNYCQQKNINLLRISYMDFCNIDNILTKVFTYND